MDAREAWLTKTKRRYVENPDVMLKECPKEYRQIYDSIMCNCNFSANQKKRDEDKAKNEKMRLQKCALFTLYQGHPKWEFIKMIQEYRDTRRLPFRVSDPIAKYQIMVCIRKRPIQQKKLESKDVDVTTIYNGGHVIVHRPQTKLEGTKHLDNQTFRFDYSFNKSAFNEIVYRFTAQPLIKTIFERGFATCFAYGQTGFGKTHTMGGDFQGKAQEIVKGIYTMTARDVFQLYNREYKTANLIVSCSFYEIYGGKIVSIAPGMSFVQNTLNSLRYADRVKELGKGGPVEIKRWSGGKSFAAKTSSRRKPCKSKSAVVGQKFENSQ